MGLTLSLKVTGVASLMMAKSLSRLALDIKPPVNRVTKDGIKAPLNFGCLMNLLQQDFSYENYTKSDAHTSE